MKHSANHRGVPSTVRLSALLLTHPLPPSKTFILWPTDERTLEFYGIEIARKIESYRKRRTTNCFIQIRGRPTAPK